ncbi:hypothetical protein [Massilia soli]|uniref:Uncharacterized protein n=1 Tax=Massilia soli TaxID=2792854 RepID=A0ABS7SQX9_9BURK|nr:hypothetical protein [Massilia soli]MBZ2208349.1 hypothetical protein [Massilia soli]
MSIRDARARPEVQNCGKGILLQSFGVHAILPPLSGAIFTLFMILIALVQSTGQGVVSLERYEAGLPLIVNTRRGPHCRMRDGAVAGGQRFGYPFKPGTSTLALYVDQPARFVDAVGAALARQLPRYA